MITISLCMIVKNEAENLRRCLHSLRGLMDEIIIVDTGSGDETVEIAKSFTDKVFHFEWCDDFSKARNFACAKASMDYIYSADADEVLDEKNRERFFQLKECLLPEIEIVQMKYTNQLCYGTTYNYDEEYRPKLFKRLRTFEWTEPLHENIRLMPVVYDSEIEIIHKPHESHASRDFAVFQKRIQNKLAISEKLHIMYARELFIAGCDDDFLMAIPYFEEKYRMEPKKETLAVLARGFRLLGSVEKFFTVCLKDVAAEGSSEVCCELGCFYEELEEYEEAVVWYYNAAFETEPVLDLRCKKKFPIEALARVYDLLGNEEQRDGYLAMLRNGEDVSCTL